MKSETDDCGAALHTASFLRKQKERKQPFGHPGEKVAEFLSCYRHLPVVVVSSVSHRLLQHRSV